MKTLRFYLVTVLIFTFIGSSDAQFDVFFKYHQKNPSIEYVQWTVDDLTEKFNIRKDEKESFGRLSEYLDVVQYIKTSIKHQLVFDEAYAIARSDYEVLVDVRSKNERIHGFIRDKKGTIKEGVLLIKMNNDIVIGRVVGQFRWSKFNDVLQSFRDLDHSNLDDNMKDHSDENSRLPKTNATDLVQNFTVYPNPISKQQPIIIRFDTNAPLDQAQIMILDLSGKSLFQQKLGSLDAGFQEIIIDQDSIDFSESILVSIVRHDDILSKVVIVQ